MDLTGKSLVEITFSWKRWNDPTVSTVILPVALCLKQRKSHRLDMTCEKQYEDPSTHIFVRNTATGRGNDLPTRLGNHISFKKYARMRPFIVFHMSSPMFQTKCHRQNDHTDRGIISLFLWKSGFDIVFSSQIHDLHAKPIFVIVCIIGISLYVQHIQLYII